MRRVPEIIPVTDLRQDAAAVLDRVRGSNHPLVITQRGRAAAVLMSVGAYERIVYEREVLGILARGEEEIKEAKGFSLDRVLAEAADLLSEGGR